jgi:hypothetical protein
MSQKLKIAFMVLCIVGMFLIVIGGSNSLSAESGSLLGDSGIDLSVEKVVISTDTEDIQVLVNITGKMGDLEPVWGKISRTSEQVVMALSGKLVNRTGASFTFANSKLRAVTENGDTMPLFIRLGTNTKTGQPFYALTTLGGFSHEMITNKAETLELIV